MVQEFLCLNLAEFQEVAKKITINLPPKVVITLSGPLGSGKTEFVKTVCAQRGVKEVSSPTYAIHQHYPGIDHLDLYRLENEEDLESAGFWDLFSQGEGLIFIEWPEKMKLHQLPSDWELWQIEIEMINNLQRKIRWTRARELKRP